MKAMILMSAMMMAVGAAWAQVQILNEVWIFDARPTAALTLHNCGSAANLSDYCIANGDTVFTLPELVLQQGERHTLLVNAEEPVELRSGGGLVDQIPALQHRWRARTTAPEAVLGTFDPESWKTAHCGDPYWVEFECNPATAELPESFGAVKSRFR